MMVLCETPCSPESPGDGEIAAPAGENSGGGGGGQGLWDKPTPKEIFGDDIAGLISDAFEKHLPDPSVLVEPAQAYAETLTEATIEKLSPLTNLVRDQSRCRRSKT